MPTTCAGKTHLPSQRPGGIILDLFLVLLLVFFVGMVIYRGFFLDPHFQANEERLAELGREAFIHPPTKQQSSDWPQWLGPDRDGVTRTSDLLTSWAEDGPPEVWRSAAGGGYSSLAIEKGKVYTLFGAEGKEAVVCLDANTGDEVWRKEYELASSEPNYPGSRATPTLVNGKVYAMGMVGNLHCLEAETGKVVWSYDLLENGAGKPKWGMACSPLVEGDLVYVQPGPEGKTVAAFHKDTGKVAWTALNAPPGYSSPVAANIAGVRQVVFFTGSRAVGLRAKDGEVLWQHPWQTFADVNAATPLVFTTRAEEDQDESTRNLTSYLFLSSGYDKGCVLLKLTRDEETFRAQPVFTSDALESQFSTPIRHGQYVYGLDERRGLTCLDLQTGKLRWRQRYLKSGEGSRRDRMFMKGSLIRVNDYLLVLSEKGWLGLIEATPEGYQEKAVARVLQHRFWSEEVRQTHYAKRYRCWTVPAFADGKLFLRDEYTIRCLDLREK